MASPNSFMSNPVLLKLVIGIMLKRLGGTFFITQADIDQMAYNKFDEVQEFGTLKLTLVERKPTQ